MHNCHKKQFGALNQPYPVTLELFHYSCTDFCAGPLFNRKLKEMQHEECYSCRTRGPNVSFFFDITNKYCLWTTLYQKGTKVNSVSWRFLPLLLLVKQKPEPMNYSMVCRYVTWAASREFKANGAPVGEVLWSIVNPLYVCMCVLVCVFPSHQNVSSALVTVMASPAV